MSKACALRAQKSIRFVFISEFRKHVPDVCTLEAVVPTSYLEKRSFNTL